MLLHGMRHALAVGGDPRRAIVLREGSEAELTSQFDAAAAARIAAAPELERAQAEVVVTMTLARQDGGGAANAVLRGVEAGSLALRPELRLVAGRWPGAPRELLVGRALIGRYRGVRLDQDVDLGDGREPARVVGVFATGGSPTESEIWGDLAFVQAVAGRRGLYSSLLVRLRRVEDFPRLADLVAADREAGLVAEREPEYLDRQGDRLARFLLGIAALLGVCFSLAAAMGVAVTMHAQVARRARELGTLRALGFSRAAVLTGMLFEALVIGAAGALLGLAGAALLAHARFSLVNVASWSQLIFELRLSPGVVGASLAVALGAGLVGGLVPALRAAAIPPAHALKR
jgi:putative ABC transport system permease protein